MITIAHCTNKDCPLRDECMHSYPVKDEPMQPYFRGEPYPYMAEEETVHCDDYWEAPRKDER